jgi:hypothetical protein
MTATRSYSSEAVDALWRRAKGIIGGQQLGILLRRHRKGALLVRHRLIDQLIVLDEFRAGRLTAIREDAALVALPEVDSILTLAEEAKGYATPAAWKEIRRGFVSPAEYLHSVGVVQVASLLHVHHPAVAFIASGTTREPDLILEVTDALPLAVEVKAPAILWLPSAALDLSAGRHLIRNTLANAGTVQGQLREDRPGVLALSALLMSQHTYDTLVLSCEHHLASDGAKTPHLLGLAVANLRGRVESEPGRVLPLLEQQSVIRRNPSYQGPLVIDNDWAGPWHLVKR